MTQSTYEILARILHDNDSEIHRTSPGQYADGMAATGARIRAAMAGLPRSSGAAPGWNGGGYDPKPPAPPPPSDDPAAIAEDHGPILDVSLSDEAELSPQHRLSNR